MIRVTVWNEGVHEAESREVAAVYPEGIHGQLKSFLGAQEDMEVRTATLREPDAACRPKCSKTPMCSSGGDTRRTTKCPTSLLSACMTEFCAAWAS